MPDNSSLGYSIGTFAKAFNIHQRTLRIYDKAGILIPKRTAKNRRMYFDEDCKKLEFIQFLTGNLGLNIAGVKIINTLFEKYEINQSEYINTIKNIAKTAKIDNIIQNKNLTARKKKGKRIQK